MAKKLKIKKVNLGKPSAKRKNKKSNQAFPEGKSEVITVDRRGLAAIVAERRHYVPFHPVADWAANGPLIQSGQIVVVWADSQVGKTYVAIRQAVAALRTPAPEDDPEGLWYVRISNNEGAELEGLFDQFGVTYEELQGWIKSKRLIVRPSMEIEDSYRDSCDSIEATVDWFVKEQKSITGWDQKKKRTTNSRRVLCVWDSLAGTESDWEANLDLAKVDSSGVEQVTKDRVGNHAKACSRALRKLSVWRRRTGACTLINNQVRNAIDNGYDSRAMPGGKAIKFYADSIFWMLVTKTLTKDNKQKKVKGRAAAIRGKIPIGTCVRWVTEKTRGGPGKREVDWNFYFLDGKDKLYIDEVEAMAHFLLSRAHPLVKHNTVNKKTRFRYKDKVEETFWSKFVDKLRASPAIVRNLTKAVMKYREVES